MVNEAHSAPQRGPEFFPLYHRLNEELGSESLVCIAKHLLKSLDGGRRVLIYVLV